MSFGFVAASSHYCRTISRRRCNFDRRCATFRCRYATSPCFVARSRGGSPTFGLHLTGWTRCLAICSALDAPSLIFRPQCAQNCPEVSKIHTARKTEQVIVCLILRERDYVWYRTFESSPTVFVGRPSFFGESATPARRKHHLQSRKQVVERGTAVEKKRFVGTLEEKTAVKCPIAWAFP